MYWFIFHVSKWLFTVFIVCTSQTIYSFSWTFISLIIRANFILITKLVNVIIIKLREYQSNFLIHILFKCLFHFRQALDPIKNLHWLLTGLKDFTEWVLCLCCGQIRWISLEWSHWAKNCQDKSRLYVFLIVVALVSM